MRLIGSLTSPYVRKVRIVLAEKKLEYKLELDDPWSAQSTVVDSNPLGKVPCLVLEGGEALFDSRVIAEYVDTLSPVGRLIPERGRERAEVRTWEALADGVMDAAVAARMEAHWPGRTAEQRSQAWIDRQLGKIDSGLDGMSRALGDRAWCVGLYISLADIACGCALDYLDFRFPEIDWRARHANLAKLAAKLGQRPSFTQTAPPAA
jgi:glutathione S-transferase